MIDNDAKARTQLFGAVAAIVTSTKSLLEEMAAQLHPGSEADDSFPETLDCAAFQAFVRHSLDDMSRPLLGMGFLPNVALMPGAAIRWWYHRSVVDSVPLRPLSASTHPEAVDYYDPESTEWWQDAAASAAPSISGPYVDRGGTNAYVVTFAQAIRRSRDVLGVVAIDVRVAKLQATCEYDLLDLPRPTSVINRSGIVIATNAGNLLGNVVEVPDARTDTSCHPIPETPWFLFPAR